MTRRTIITALLFACLCFTSLSCRSRSSSPTPALPPPSPSQEIHYVIMVSVDGLSGVYLDNLLNGTTRTASGEPYVLPNFQRLVSAGAGTMYAHCDNGTYETLPNHVGMLTGRPRDGEAGHGWTLNDDGKAEFAGATLHSVKGVYVSSVFDVAHDSGLVTGLYANKSKFSVFRDSCNAANSDNGQDKVDYFRTISDGKDDYTGAQVVQAYMDQQQSGGPLIRFAFLHVNNLDNCGHNYRWGSPAWNEQVVAVDAMVGRLFAMIDSIEAMKDHTAIILTADHGEQNFYDGVNTYAVPLLVWGPGVAGGSDLYKHNADTRQMPDWAHLPLVPKTKGAGAYAAGYVYDYDHPGPIRNAEAANLALTLLGLGTIPGSVFGASQDLRVSTTR